MLSRLPKDEGYKGRFDELVAKTKTVEIYQENYIARAYMALRKQELAVQQEIAQ